MYHRDIEAYRPTELYIYFPFFFTVSFFFVKQWQKDVFCRRKKKLRHGYLVFCQSVGRKGGREGGGCVFFFLICELESMHCIRVYHILYWDFV